ncbi:uncharacterized protein LOC126664641 [Mercurialis annua]|uniref:uncharacterized protein LOC126664641 n=1 Tax=Mercurialis annua TaxID=3986 RepID=UPI002160913B|nr:uncharacterized protein LOC126664641 [Mercurialis annua]
MGCCISKCKPKKHYNLPHYSNHNNILEDKLVISQQSLKTPKIISIINPESCSSNKISPSPSSPSPTTSTSTSTISSCSLLSTGSSSILIPKDRSFSNEFLWSCVKENPHIVRINSIKEYSQLVPPNAVHVRKSDYEAVAHGTHSIPQKKLQKRVRSNSPTPIINRQKSFRRESERVVYPPYHSPQYRSLRSPPLSRRFSTGENCSKRMVNNLKVNATNNYNSFSSSYRKENYSMIKPVSPCFNSSHRRQVQSCLKINRETCVHRIRSKIDEVAVEEAVGQYDSEVTPMEEDIDNPLISLDCFIFV